MRRNTIYSTGETVQTLDRPYAHGVLKDNSHVLLAEAQALSTRLAALNELTVVMQTNIDTNISTMLHIMAQQARWVLDFDYCTVVLQQGEKARVYVLHDSQVREKETIELFAEHIKRRRHARLVDRLSSADGGPAGMQSALLLPLHGPEHIIGTLSFYAKKADTYVLHDLRIATQLASHVAAMVQNERLLHAVKSARDELYTILEAIGDGVLVLDTHARVLLCNRAMQQLVGHPEAVNVGSRALALVRNSDAAGTRLIGLSELRTVWSTMQGNCPWSDSATTSSSHAILTLNDGRFVEWAGVPLVEAGAVSGYVVTLRDVSAKIALERLQEEMAQMLVHDLRSPLSSIIMGLNMLEMEGYDDHQRQRTQKYMRQGAHGMLEHINTLLDVNKLKEGQLHLQYGICSTRWQIQTVIDPLVPLAQANNQRLEIDVANEDCSIECDPDMIRRVLQNLVDNALKFTPSGGKVTVGLQINQQDGYVQYSISDTGPGIPKEDHARLFQKYGQLQMKGKRRGTGLGLMFCRLVVEAHQGRIGVRNAAGGGSEFWFRLPILKSE